MKAQMSAISLHTQVGKWDRPVSAKFSCYLFAALSEADRHTLTREELPHGGRLAWPQSRSVACCQRFQLEGLSELLNLLQSVSPLTHFQVPINHLYVTLYCTHRAAGSSCIHLQNEVKGQLPCSIMEMVQIQWLAQKKMWIIHGGICAI